MRLFFRAHRAATVLLVSAVMAGLAWWLSEHAIPMPQLLRGRAEVVPFHILFAAMFAPLAAHTFGGRPLLLEHAAKRSLMLPDLLLAGNLLLPPLLVVVTAALVGDQEFALAFLRNLTLNVGLALSLIAFRGQAIAAAVPLGYFVIAGTLGGQVDGAHQWWAIIRWPGGAMTAMLGVAWLFACLLWFHHRARRRAWLAPVR
jgi:hypothetical protein